MFFNSLHFLIFFPLVVILYFSLPHKYRWPLLLGASYYFYMCWKAEYLLLILLSTVIDYYSGLQMGKYGRKIKRRSFLVLSLLTNLGLLFSFKYFNFFNESTREIFNHYNIFYEVPSFNVLLPVGISFYTFQTLSYAIDVYRGEREPEKHFGIFALYVAFFPQLVAGPIERSTRLMPQFYNKCDLEYQRVINGLKLMTWGFFKKLVIADRLAIFVNQVYNDPINQDGSVLILATYLFAFQIYCDFSGYSDIAIGAARVLGYELMDNFKTPYYSKSISEFWTRWHISLSSWFRDYLYISLGGNRVVRWRWYRNLIIVFLVSGLWHGANWTYVVWGGLHGFYLLFSIWTKNLRERTSQFFHLENFPKILKLLKVFFTFHLVAFSWIFFRANSISDAMLIIEKMFQSNLLFLKHFVIQNRYELKIALLGLLFMELIQLIKPSRQFLSEKPIWYRWAVYYILILGIFMFGEFNLTEFIYFQF